MNHLQMLVDGMGLADSKKRAETQMTLGSMISTLEALPGGMLMCGLKKPHSYRGYYTDLAFEKKGRRKVSDVLADCRLAMGEVFVGYKGGDFMMGRNTPIWVAEYGCCGDKLMSITPKGDIVTEED